MNVSIVTLTPSIPVLTSLLVDSLEESGESEEEDDRGPEVLSDDEDQEDEPPEEARVNGRSLSVSESSIRSLASAARQELAGKSKVIA